MSKRNSTISSTKSRDRFNASEVIKYYEKNGLIKKKRPPSIPKAANWGWNHLPMSAKIMILGVFSGAVSVTTPYWAYLRSDSIGYATFGLWHFCSDDHCSSIHDNLVEEKSVETWYHLVQGCMCIGVALSIVGLGMLTNSIEGRQLKMSITVHWTCACVLAISALEHFLALYVFISYLEDTSFLFVAQYTQQIELYGSCYMAIVSFACSLVASFAVFIDENIYTRPRKIGMTVTRKVIVMDMVGGMDRWVKRVLTIMGWGVLKEIMRGIVVTMVDMNIIAMRMMSMVMRVFLARNHVTIETGLVQSTRKYEGWRMFALVLRGDWVF